MEASLKKQEAEEEEKRQRVARIDDLEERLRTSVEERESLRRERDNMDDLIKQT